MPCVVQDAEGQYLLCYYHESSNSVTRGNQICLARCPIETSGMPGTWKKHYRDDFTEPGLGGKETPVISAGAANATTCPHVQYVKEWNRYVMIFGLIAGNDFLTNPQKASGSGTFVTTSRDGRNWTEPVKIETIFPAAINGHEAKIPTSLLITKATSTKIQGSLYYGYSPRWPIPHHMGSMPIQIALVNRDSAGESGSGPADFSGKPSPISFDGKTVVQTPLKRRSPVTLEAWIRPERNEKDVFVIGSMSAARHGIGLGLNNGILRAQYLYGDLGAPSRVPDSEWSHVAAVFGTDATHLYLNGKHVAKGPANSTCDDQPLFVIGDIGWDFSGHLFRGVVRAVRISDGVRYDRDFLPEGAFTQDSPTQKAKALLIYDGSRNASGEMLDRSGAGNHGRLVDSQPRKASPK